MRDDGRPPDEQSWHDRESVVWAAGAAAVALVGLLAFAVIRTSEDATEPPHLYAPAPGTTTSEPTLKTVTSTTSYAVPSVQTSQYTPPSTPSSTSQTSLPPTEVVGPDGNPVIISPSAPSTIFNPYATTTQPSAGHV